MNRLRHALHLTVGVSLALVSGCASMATMANPFAPPPAPDGWTREQFRMTGSGCRMRNCHTSLKGVGGALEVTTSLKEYARREVPGWNTESTGDRVAGAVAGAVAGGIVRNLGGSTERTPVVHGPMAVTESQAEGWRMTCTVFGMFVEQTGNNAAGFTPLAGGTDCLAARRSDSTQVLWRFSRGIAPPLASVARVYDSLSAERSPLIGRSPPMTLERLDPDGKVTARYEVVMVSLVRLLVSRENREPVAAIYSGLGMLDLAPGATEDEAHVARLIAASMVASPEAPSARPGGRPPGD